MAIPPLPDIPRLRDRVSVVGRDGVYIVIACNSLRCEVDLAGASNPGFLFAVPLSQIRPVSDLTASDRTSTHSDHEETRLAPHS